MEDTLISVIVPVYNAEKYLKECIDSILQQSYRNLELIAVVDGKSNDNSMDILNHYAEKDKRVILCNENTIGVSDNRYAGFKRAKGEYISFVDSDDLLNKYALEVLLENCEKCNSEVAVGRYIEFKENVVEVHKKIVVNSYLLEGFDKRNTECHVPLWGKLYKKCLLQGIDFEKCRKAFPHQYYEDMFLTPLLLDITQKVVVIESGVYYYRYNELSLSRKSTFHESHLEIYKVKKHLLNLFKERSPNILYPEALREYGNCLIKAYIGTYSSDSFTTVQKTEIYKEINIAYDKIYSVLMKEATINIPMRISFIIFKLSPKLWQGCFGTYYKKHYWNFRKINKAE